MLSLVQPYVRQVSRIHVSAYMRMAMESRVDQSFNDTYGSPQFLRPTNSVMNLTIYGFNHPQHIFNKFRPAIIQQWWRQGANYNMTQQQIKSSHFILNLFNPHDLCWPWNHATKSQLCGFTSVLLNTIVTNLDLPLSHSGGDRWLITTWPQPQMKSAHFTLTFLIITISDDLEFTQLRYGNSASPDSIHVNMCNRASLSFE